MSDSPLPSPAIAALAGYPASGFVRVAAPELPAPIPLPKKLPMNPETSFAARALLERIQGNILKGHGRPFTRLLMFRFQHFGDPANRAIFPAARLHEPKLITSAMEQYEASPKRGASTDTEFYSVMLTTQGMLACGYSKEKDYPPETSWFADFFRNGSRNAPESDPLYRGRALDVHGIWLLAHQEKTMLATMEERIVALVGKVVTVVEREDGFVWADPPPADAPPGSRGVPREPFGFRDGISNPNFVVPGPASGPWVQGKLKRVLIADGGPHFGGSFFVFSKLDQNVAAFRRAEKSLRETGKLPESIRDPGAVFIGRDREGTPLAETNGGGIDQFDFDGPPSDARCPFHAHIRKANPRSKHSTVLEANENVALVRAQFVRRSVVYDEPAEPGKPEPQLPPFAAPNYPEGEKITGNVGLLFMAYMRDIGEQFVTMRHNWLPSVTFPDPATARGDALLGGSGKWAWPAIDPELKLDAFAQFVRPRGDLYLYVPSITWLENAWSPTPPPAPP